MTPPTDDPIHPLCNSHDLVDGGRAVSFDVNYAGRPAAPLRCVFRASHTPT
jgi:hypothetical protein